jgi:hypothetical protein
MFLIESPGRQDPPLRKGGIIATRGKEAKPAPILQETVY